MGIHLHCLFCIENEIAFQNIKEYRHVFALIARSKKMRYPNAQRLLFDYLGARIMLPSQDTITDNSTEQNVASVWMINRRSYGDLLESKTRIGSTGYTCRGLQRNSHESDSGPNSITLCVPMKKRKEAYRRKPVLYFRATRRSQRS